MYTHKLKVTIEDPRLFVDLPRAAAARREGPRILVEGSAVGARVEVVGDRRVEGQVGPGRGDAQDDGRLRAARRHGRSGDAPRIC